MSDRYESPALSEQDPAALIRSVAGQARIVEIQARAELARVEILLEGRSHRGTVLPGLREKQAGAARIARRWARALEVMETASLLGDLDGE